MKSSTSSTKGKGLLAQNTLVNVMGRGIPLLFAAITIPFVIDGLGTERFGVLTIVWIVIGYFGLFDMGLGRATTKFVADEEARGVKQLFPVIFTSVALLIIFGILAGILIFFATPYLVHDLLNIPGDLTGETQSAFYILSASIPLVLGSVGARGILEGQQRFTLVNTVKIPASIINYVGPLLMLPFSNQLHHIVLLLVAGRAGAFIIYLYFSFRDRPFLSPSAYPFFAWTKKLLNFGAWLTISNFISPIMMYMDRFILGAILTMSAVAYYTTPYEMVSRIGIISGGFMGVMFPAFSVYSLNNRDKLAALYQKSIRYLLLALVPVVVFLVMAAEPLLYYWLGNEFADNSTTVLQILAVGVFINSLAMVPSTLIQAAGRPDIRAKLHMTELPVYLVMIWFFAQWMGVTGVALAWVLRVTIDGGLLIYFCNRLVSLMDNNRNERYRQLGLYGLLFGMMAILFFVVEGRILLLGIGTLSAIFSFYIIWLRTLKQEERNRILALYHELKKHFLTKNTYV